MKHELAGRALPMAAVPRSVRLFNWERTLAILSPVLLLLAWELAVAIEQIDARFFPPPSRIFHTLAAMVASGEMASHLGISLQRVAIGFLLGAVPGVIIGLAMGLLPLVRAAISPLVDATYPIPKIALLPMFIMIFGIGEESKYAIIATSVIYLVLINTESGVRNLEKIYLDVGKNFHASRKMMFLDIALPGAMPMIVTGLKLGMGIALLVIVAAEFVGAKSGIGYLIWTSWQTFEVEKMYVGLLIMAILGFVSTILLNAFERFAVPWKAR